MGLVDDRCLALLREDGAGRLRSRRIASAFDASRAPLLNPQGGSNETTLRSAGPCGRHHARGRSGPGGQSRHRLRDRPATTSHVLRAQLDVYEKQSGDKVTIVPMPSSTTDQFGQYKLWLAAGNSDIDVYQTDVIWAPQLADQLRRPDRRRQGRRQGPLPVDHRIADGGRQAGRACRSSPTRRRSITARICSTSTAPRCRRPGTRWPPPPR